jgi:peptidyl-prolyl cis-trans isomerase B (cyclophilin B)
MKRFFTALLSTILFTAAAHSQSVKPVVSIMTSKGEIVVELDSARAPISVRNFLDYVNEGFYDGTVFHRVIKGFMIQGGGFTADMNKKPTKPPIRNEATNRVSNRRSTIAMARTPDPHSASSQFFINTVNNDGLDFKNESQAGWGYCVFGRVTKGMDVVDAIADVATTSNAMMQNVPVTPVVITKAKVVTPPQAEKK